MRTNAGPIVLPYDEAPASILKGAPDLDELRRRASRIVTDSAFADRLIAVFLQTREEKQPSPFVEEQIYDGFITNPDQALLDRFHAAEWRLRAPLVGRLADQRLRALGQRLIFAEAPEVMERAARRDYEIAIARRLLADGNCVPWLTLPKAIADADNLLANASGPERKLLADLHCYLTEQAQVAASLLA
jgi:exodeoxyribonuclease I